RPRPRLHVGLDRSRRRLDYIALTEDGTDVDVGAAPPDADGLRGLATRSPHAASRSQQRSNR
ncbi:MAG TPA: hypothetical protein VFA45_12675, partial [Actinomycetes bacterium]|nr:hypothetical protein [Actinomycetes bacterium]